MKLLKDIKAGDKVWLYRSLYSSVDEYKVDSFKQASEKSPCTDGSMGQSDYEFENKYYIDAGGYTFLCDGEATDVAIDDGFSGVVKLMASKDMAVDFLKRTIHTMSDAVKNLEKSYDRLTANDHDKCTCNNVQTAGDCINNK